jgi:hypothetical protein
MPLVSLTRLRLRSVRYLLPFALQSHRISRQAERTSGFIGGKVYGEPLRLTFWTATLWQNEAAMRGFRGFGAHQIAMPKLANWCDEASVLHWNQPGNDVPEPEIILLRMQRDGRLLSVRYPSPDHAARRIAADNRAPAKGSPLRQKQG